MNLFTFSGFLGKDAEIRTTPNGKRICEFSVAVKSGYGEREKTNWVRCALFGNRVEGQLPQYLKKGTQVIVSGELELQEWEGQNGKGAALAVKVDKLDLIGGKPQGTQQPQQCYQAPQQPQQPAQNGYQQAQQGGYQPPQQNNQSGEVFPDDIPF